MRTFVVASILLAATAASARPRPVLIDVPRHRVDPPQAVVSSRLIYMHRCPLNGCVIRPGNENSIADTSTIAEETVTIGRFKQSDEIWEALMQCMRDTYAPFNVGVTDVDPGNVPHYENIVGGRPTELRGDLAGAGGVAPFTCQEIPNAISFTFDVYGPDVDALCWTAAQETAHAFGLEHEYNAADPMTYLNGGPSRKKFQAADSPCGEFQPSTCRCGGGQTQNSYQHIFDMFGPGVPTAPTVAIAAPTSGKKVQPKFITRVQAMDDVGIDRVELWIDGVNTGVVAKAQPYNLVAPDTLAPGPHTVEVKAFDVQDTPATATIEVDLGPPCTASKGCSGVDVCVMGVCVPGPEQPGGLGSYCNVDRECLSGKCIADATSGTRACVEACDLSDGSCPDDFACIAAPTGGVCWVDESGCCSTSRHPASSFFLGAGVLVLALRRRRR